MPLNKHTKTAGKGVKFTDVFIYYLSHPWPIAFLIHPLNT